MALDSPYRAGSVVVPLFKGRLVVKTIRALLVCMVLSCGFETNPLVTAASQNTGSKTVNVEIIVDASGSMAAETNTGELRIDSAKRVLTEVINTIPEAEGVNVGLRVYGHLGDNTDEGRAESCVSSDLLVPIDGVNKTDLLEQVDTLKACWMDANWLRPRTGIGRFLPACGRRCRQCHRHGHRRPGDMRRGPGGNRW